MTTSSASDPWPDFGAACGVANPQEEQQKRSVSGAQAAAAKSAAATGGAPWGASYEDDGGSEHKQDDSSPRATNNKKPDGDSGGSGDTNPNQGSDGRNNGSQDDSGEADHARRTIGCPDNTNTALGSIWERAGSFLTPDHKLVIQRNVDLLADWADSACANATSPLCQPRDLFATQDLDDTVVVQERDDPVLGIARMQPPRSSVAKKQPPPPAAAAREQPLQKPPSPPPPLPESPADRRRQRHEQRTSQQPQQQISRTRTHDEIEVSPDHHVQVRLPPTNAVIVDNNNAKDGGESASNNSSKKKSAAPVKTLEVKTDVAEALERSISELTMRSSYAATEQARKMLPDNRRMAYYAVGKHHRQSGRGGNRRCYFSGKLILGGAPFYAGCVQQGMRTLVVFCLPSAVHLPGKDAMLKHHAVCKRTVGSSAAGSSNSGGGVITAMSPRDQSIRSMPAVMQMDTKQGGLLTRSSKRILSKVTTSGASVASKSYASKSMSRLSSLDDLSLSIDGDLDPNWGLDRDYLLSVLPEADPSLIQQMATLYPEQFETLPVQVRDSKKWKLYTMFCFFSGLPIAQGDLHYKVRDEIAEQVYGEDIVLSHEVMEASTGASAEILTLPNRRVMRYLRKHYAQQCSKLDGRVFQRANWERVAPEV